LEKGAFIGGRGERAIDTRKRARGGGGGGGAGGGREGGRGHELR